MSKNIANKLVIDIVNLQGKTHKRIGVALSAHGISLSDYFVLNQLYIAPDQKMRRSDLAERVSLSPSGITRLLNPLEKIGLVEKESNPRDARVSLVTLSVAGKRVYEEAQISFGHASAELFKQLNAKQQRTFSELLKAMS